MRKNDQESYIQLYENASRESIYMAMDHSIIIMLKNYLLMASLNLDSDLRKKIEIKESDEIISINVLSTLVDNLAA